MNKSQLAENSQSAKNVAKVVSATSSKGILIMNVVACVELERDLLNVCHNSYDEMLCKY